MCNPELSSVQVNSHRKLEAPGYNLANCTDPLQIDI